MIEMEKLVHRPDYYLDLITLSLDTLREKYEKAERPQGHHLLRLPLPGEEVLRIGLQ